MNALVKHKHNGYRLRILPDLIEREFLDICCNERLRESDDCRRVPASAHARVFCLEYRGRRYFHKTFCPRTVLEPVKNYIRGSRARRSVKAYLLLMKNGFCAPQPVLLGHKKQHNFLVTTAVPDCISFASFLGNRPDSKNRNAAWISRSEKTRQIERLGKLVGRMHAANITHGDLLCGNILLSGEQGRYDIYFIDNENTRRYFILPPKRRLKNLVQLNLFRHASLSNADRLRFFKQYLSENPKIRSAEKYWIKKILNRTVWRLDRKAQKRKARV